MSAVTSIDETAKAVMANGWKPIMQKSIIVGVGALMFLQDTEGNVAVQYDRLAE